MLPFLMTVSAVPAKERTDANATEKLIARMADGDKTALAELYESTHAAVYGFALSILKNKADAEDVLHDAYLQVWSAADRYAPQGKPLAWIFTITRNLALMRLREQSRTVQMVPEDYQELFAQDPGVASEDRLLLAALLNTLSAEERQIVMLHAMTGLKHREIAELLELKLTTVLSKYNRAIRKLREAEQGGRKP